MSSLRSAACSRRSGSAMIGRSCLLTVILGTTLWFIIPVGLHWYFGVW